MTRENGVSTTPEAAPVDPSRPRRFVATTVEIEGREETRIVELPDRTPAPWGADADLHVVGARVPRMDALEKVTGAARFTADLQRPGMTFAVIVRSPVPAGRLAAVDAAAALAMPGVRAVLTLEDVRGIRAEAGQLLDDTIRYAGQPLCVVCADTFGAARAAAGAVKLSIEPAPHAVTADQALAEGAPKLRSRGNVSPRSPRIIQRGDVDAGLRAADVTITREYRTPVALHTALEPHGAVAEWEGDRLTVWESTQGIFMTRRDLAAAFQLKLTNVRVMKDYMGGGFGAKNGASAAAYIAAALSRNVGRPVRCVFDRYGEQTDAGNRAATVQRVTLGARRDGTLTAIRMDATIPLGVGGWEAGPGRIYHELHACENVRTSETFVYTNAGADGVLPRARAHRGCVRAGERPERAGARIESRSAGAAPAQLRRHRPVADAALLRQAARRVLSPGRRALRVERARIATGAPVGTAFPPRIRDGGLHVGRRRRTAGLRHRSHQSRRHGGGAHRRPGSRHGIAHGLGADRRRDARRPRRRRAHRARRHRASALRVELLGVDHHGVGGPRGARRPPRKPATACSRPRQPCSTPA